MTGPLDALRNSLRPDRQLVWRVGRSHSTMGVRQKTTAARQWHRQHDYIIHVGAADVVARETEAKER